MKLNVFFDKITNKIDWAVRIPLNAKRYRRKLKYSDFTVISNNCWGGRCYEYFGLPKLSPTIGAYFYAEDYVKFCKNLKYYLGCPLDIQTAKDSKHYEDMKEKGEGNVFIGKLDDVEIVFLHYNDKETILEKWNRRINRINWERIILKFSYQNNCTEELVKEFLEIPEYKKFCLVGKKITDDENELLYKRSNGYETIDETYNFDKYLNIINIINDRL